MLLAKPKIIIFTVLLTLAAGGAWHYRHLIARNADLTSRLVQALAVQEDLESQLQAERRAAVIALEQRAAAQSALDELRRGRLLDESPDFLEWGALPVPPTERARICAALPGADGCE